MTKFEQKVLAEYFGSKLPASKIKDRDVRIAIVRLYGSLAKAQKDVIDEMETIRKGLVGDKEEEIRKWSELDMKGRSGDEEAKKEADAMTECVRINEDYIEAVNKLLAEESNAEIKKVSLEVLYEALTDCGFIGFEPELTLAQTEDIFKLVIE